MQWTAFIKNSRSELIGKQIRSFFGRPRHRLSPKYSTNWGQLRCLYPPPTQKYYHSCGWKKRIPSVDKCSTHRSGNAQCSFFFKSKKFRKTLLVEENCSANCANVARLQVFAEDRKIQNVVNISSCVGSDFLLNSYSLRVQRRCAKCDCSWWAERILRQRVHVWLFRGAAHGKWPFVVSFKRTALLWAYFYSIRRIKHFVTTEA